VNPENEAAAVRDRFTDTEAAEAERNKGAGTEAVIKTEAVIVAEAAAKILDYRS
jgi:hypothetical protein